MLCMFIALFYIHIVDRKNCEGMVDKPQDLGYNAALFTWDPKLGARVSLCIQGIHICTCRASSKKAIVLVWLAIN